MNTDNMCGQRALAYHLAFTHGMKGVADGDFYHWIRSKKNRDNLEKTVGELNTALFGRKKNCAMEFQDFQRFTDLFNVRVVINMYNPGQRTHVLYRTDGSEDTVHLLLQEIVRLEEGRQTSAFHYHYVRN